MASDQAFIEFVCEQLRAAGEISSRRMFGEAAIYLQEKVIGLVCDNQLFLKPTDAGRALIGVPKEARPYPGAGNWFLMADLDDPDFLAELARTTAAALPPPKIKPKRSKANATFKPTKKKTKARKR